MDVRRPLALTDMAGRVDVFVNVNGSGKLSQSGAVLLGLARALKEYRPDLEPKLRETRLLDPRRPHGRAQEVRPQEGAQELPVLASAERRTERPPYGSHRYKPIRIVAPGRGWVRLLRFITER